MRLRLAVPVRPPSLMLLPWMKWSLTVVWRKVGVAEVALKDWA